jgi:hypothetical protein
MEKAGVRDGIILILLLITVFAGIRVILREETDERIDR